MRLAAIDVGSNSVHLIIADVSREGHIEVIDRVKEMVRLGRRSFTTGRLTPEAMDMAVRTLSYFKRLAHFRHVDRMRAVATSAVREAKNRIAFIQRIRRETGLAVEVISGDEEARLIFEAARHAFGLEGGPHLLVDIGGGSAELGLVKDGKPLWLKSAKLGAARLTERFLPDDPPTATQRKDLIKHLDDEIGEAMREARKAGVIRAIGTSGSINTLVAMARAARGEEWGRLHGANASAEEVARITTQLVEANSALRPDLPGMDAKRTDQIGAAALLTDYVLRKSGAPYLTACTWAIREGLLLGLMRKDGNHPGMDARRRSVLGLATRFGGRNMHGKHVAKLALALYDATALVLGLNGKSRELLEYAALLHDIGHTIDHDRHNRHSYYLIKNGELLGFDPIEIEIIALSARGHRKQGGQFYSEELRPFSAGEKRTVRALAAILRVADALDRSHFGVIKKIKTHYSPGRLTLEVSSNDESADLEIWTTERRTDLLAKLLDRRIILEKSS
ncbi:MAG TPA: Ppx/GppA phosphatase family protein [Candidatus Binataceae bacterium]|nr:Ppx/GppA phosphatase family protein [Candidatus Binataceae bacterium]